MLPRVCVRARLPVLRKAPRAVPVRMLQPFTQLWHALAELMTSVKSAVGTAAARLGHRMEPDLH